MSRETLFLQQQTKRPKRLVQALYRAITYENAFSRRTFRHGLDRLNTNTLNVVPTKKI